MTSVKMIVQSPKYLFIVSVSRKCKLQKVNCRLQTGYRIQNANFSRGISLLVFFFNFKKYIYFFKRLSKVLSFLLLSQLSMGRGKWDSSCVTDIETNLIDHSDPLHFQTEIENCNYRFWLPKFRIKRCYRNLHSKSKVRTILFCNAPRENLLCNRSVRRPLRYKSLKNQQVSSVLRN